MKMDVNQAAITGESVPVAKTVMIVFAGTLNEEGPLEVKSPNTYRGYNYPQDYSPGFEEAQRGARSSASIRRQICGNIIRRSLWLLRRSLQSFHLYSLVEVGILWVYQGLAVLVVGCPCALVISTPPRLSRQLEMQLKRCVD